jgi:class 3 adenylate cyclase
MTSVFGTPAAAPPPRLPRRRSAAIRVAIWTLHIGVPLVALWLFIANPNLDPVWENHMAHFWVGCGVGAVSLFLGLRMSEAARRRSDARLFLVALALISGAGFFLMHALATPGVLLARKSGGFVIASPVGLLLGSVFAAASSLDFGKTRALTLMRRVTLVRTGLMVFLTLWALLSLFNLPPLRAPIGRGELRAPLTILTFAVIPLCGFAAWRYFLFHRRRPSVMPMAVITSLFLLAEAMVAIVVARNWHYSWWEWHVLMAAGLGLLAYGGQVEYSRERFATSLFRSISLEETLRRIREEYRAALESLVAAMQHRVDTGVEQPIRPIAERLARRFELPAGQIEVLEQAAGAFIGERERILRLSGLVAIGRESSVILDEPELLKHAVDVAGRAFRTDSVRVGLLDEGQLTFPPELETGDHTDAADEDERHTAITQTLLTLEPAEARLDGRHRALILPLSVKGHPAGVLEVQRESGPFEDQDRWLLESLASQLSMALENARLYRQIDTMFRSYMSPDVATALLADPSQANAGGAVVEVTVLFADLRGFSPFAERSSPEEVVTMLNRYFGIAVPLILEEGGTVAQFVGDAMMAVFNAPTRQEDHALRAARAALKMQRAIQEIALGPGWPRFRVGINTGPALVGNIGTADIRNFTALGETTNVAARLEARADAGHVVIGPATYEQIKDVAVVHPLRPAEPNAEEQPIDAYLLLRLNE